MIVKITNGEITLKDKFTHGLKKKINQALVSNAKMDGAGNVTGVGIDATDKASDVAVLGMIDKAVIDGKEAEVNQDFIDNLEQKDFELIKSNIDKITSGTLPKE